MRNHTAAEIGKSGQISDTNPKTGKMGIPGDFFPGHVIKNRDCPGNSGTDGHLKMLEFSSTVNRRSRSLQTFPFELTFKFIIPKIQRHTNI